MNSNEVRKRLFKDISFLPLPPLSDKVYQAVSEQKKRYTEMVSHHDVPEKAHRKIPVKYLLAAMVIALGISVPAVIMLSQHRVSVDTPETASGVAVSQKESALVSKVSDINALERIRLKQQYGTVTLSDRSEQELEILLEDYHQTDRAYEDERYLYHFNEQGRLIGVMNTVPLDETGFSADEQTIRLQSIDLMTLYFPDFALSDYRMEIEENEDGRPHWQVTLTKTGADHTVIKLLMNFDESGELLSIFVYGSEESAGTLSRREAVNIALQEMKSGKYDIPDDTDKEVEITVEVRNVNDTPYYVVCVAYDTSKTNRLLNAEAKINANTGEISEFLTELNLID